MDYAPIALFVYNRADHARETLEALQANTLAGESELFIFSDAPKTDAVRASVAEVRDMIRSISGFKAIHLIERERNHGLAKSIIEGVTYLIQRYDRVIVLEDDLVTSPFFLQYMNDALKRYEDEDGVMHISGYMFPVSNDELHPAFFLRTASCWGWATWARAWKHFEKNPQKLINTFDKRMIHRFNMDGTYDYWSQVLLNHSGELNTWAIFWYATVFQRGGMCLHPAISMVANIGNDGSGVNCGTNQAYEVSVANHPITKFPNRLVEDKEALARIKLFNKSLKKSICQRLMSKIKSVLLLTAKD